MPIKRYSVILALLLLFYSNYSKAQCLVTSSNGWTATITITPTAVVPEFTSCQWYYHYEIRYAYSVVFTGSATGRSISYNAYFDCSGGTGGAPFYGMGAFTANTSGTMTTNNNARQYTAVSSYYYGMSPNCGAVTLADVNCTTVRLDYWGTGVPNGTIYCPLSILPTPIELLSFEAKADDKKVNLDWSTATEHNNDFFTIEKSTDGVNFVEAFNTKGAGNSTNKLSYAATDENPYTGLSYYRLKQTDYNGDASYSNMVPVVISEGETITNAYPNPANGSTINIYVASASAAPVEVLVYNTMGQLLSAQKLQPNDKGLLDEPINLPEDGNMFLLTISQNNKVIGHHKICTIKN